MMNSNWDAFVCPKRNGKRKRERALCIINISQPHIPKGVCKDTWLAWPMKSHCCFYGDIIVHLLKLRSLDGKFYEQVNKVSRQTYFSLRKSLRVKRSVFRLNKLFKQTSILKTNENNKSESTVGCDEKEVQVILSKFLLGTKVWVILWLKLRSLHNVTIRNYEWQTKK